MGHRLRSAEAVRELNGLYLAAMEKQGKRSVGLVRGYFEREILPAPGTLKAMEVSKHKGPSAAEKVTSLVSAMYGWVFSQDLLDPRKVVSPTAYLQAAYRARSARGSSITARLLPRPRPWTPTRTRRRRPPYGLSR